MTFHRCIQFISDRLEERIRELSLLVGRLTKQVTEQAEVISSLRSENQLLRDEVARLKGQKGKPAIKPSHLAKERKKFAKDTGEKAVRERGGKKLKIDEIRKLKVKAPKGSRFLGT